MPNNNINRDVSPRAENENLTKLRKCGIWMVLADFLYRLYRMHNL